MPADVVKVTDFVVGHTPEHVPVVREVHKKYLDPERPLASPLAGVATRVVPDWLIEVGAVAGLD